MDLWVNAKPFEVARGIKRPRVHLDLTPRPYEGPEKPVLPTWSPAADTLPRSSWDETDDDNAEEQSALDAPADPFAEISWCAEMAFRGITSSLVSFASTSMRLQVAPTRVQGLSTLATIDVLQEIADVGSLVRRIAHVCTQIGALAPGRVLTALIDALRDEIRATLNSLPPRPRAHPALLGYTAAAAPQSALIRTLAVVVGCHDLTKPAHLRYLPSAVGLLDRGYAQLRYVDGTPKAVVLRRLVARALAPWVSQLNAAMASGDTVRAHGFALPPSEFAELYIPDVFAVMRGGVYELNSELVPQFMLREDALAVIECLNCLTCLAAAGELIHVVPPVVVVPFPPDQFEKPTAQFVDLHILAEPADHAEPFSLDALTRTAVSPVTPLRAVVPPCASDAAPFKSYFDVNNMFSRIAARQAELSRLLVDTARRRLQVQLHATILTEVCLLENGPLLTALVDASLPLSQPSSVGCVSALEKCQILINQRLLAMGAPACLNLRCRTAVALGSPGTLSTLSMLDSLALEYEVPKPLDVLVSSAIPTCTDTFIRVLRLEHQLATAGRRRDQRAMLGTLSDLAVLQRSIQSLSKAVHRSLSAAQTFSEVRKAFELFGALRAPSTPSNCTTTPTTIFIY